MTTYMVYTFIEPRLLARTVSRLSPGRVLIHVDAKVDEQPFVDALGAADRHRVEFVRPRYRVNWAGYSQIRAIRTLMKRALEVTDDDEYIVLLSGQDFPLYSGDALESFFADAGGRQFMRYFRIDESDDAYRAQFYERHYRDLPFLVRHPLKPILRKVRTASVLGVDRLARVRPAPRPPQHLVPCFGPTHFAITADFARYLESLITPEIEQFFKTTFCPEELMYQTLASSGPRDVNNGSPRADGSEPFIGRGNHLYANLHHIHPSLIKVYTIDDWDEVQSSDKLFLRKLTCARSMELIDRIESVYP